jgi:hypothetical protein
MPLCPLSRPFPPVIPVDPRLFPWSVAFTAGYPVRAFPTTSSMKFAGTVLVSTVTVKYGGWVRRTFEAKNLVSLNADVYFRLKSDYAKSFWPFVDSQPLYTYVDDITLAELAGRDYRAESSKKRAKCREDVVQAFTDMVSAGGLSAWRCEVLGAGRQKTYRYHYTHALERQGVLALDVVVEEATYAPELPPRL